MKRNIFIAFLVGALFKVSCAGAKDPVAVIVNGEQIKVSEIMSEMKGLDLGKDVSVDQIYRLLQNQMAELTLLVQEAKKQGLDKTPEVEKMTQKFLQRLLIQAYIGQVLQKAITKEALQEAFKSLPPQKGVNISHIVVKDEATAKAIIKALKTGSDFATLAKTKSIDTVSGKKGGELGSALEAQLPPPLAAAVKELKPGGYTQTPVKTQMGYHIIKLNSVTNASYEEVEPMIRAELEKKAIAAKVEELKKPANIQYFDQEGKPLENKPAAPAAAPAA